MFRFFIVVLAVVLPLAACGGPGKLPGTKVGKPYVIGGKTYYPAVDPYYDRTGEASWYGPGFHGKYTASGEVYDQNDYTAAHPTLPMPSIVRVTNLSNGKSLLVRVNDRGPFARNRIIDLSKKSARALGINGVAHVRVQYLQQETDDYVAMARDNGGTIIRMADFHDRRSRPPAPVVTPPAMVADAAPVMTVNHSNTAMDTAQAQPAPSPLVASARAEDRLFRRPQPAAAPDPGLIEGRSVAPLAEAARAYPAAGGGYAVQAGMFSSEGNARSLASRLESVAPVSLMPVDRDGRTLWQVRLVNLADRAAAESALERVRAAGVPDARIVSQ